MQVTVLAFIFAVLLAFTNGRMAASPSPLSGDKLMSSLLSRYGNGDSSCTDPLACYLADLSFTYDQPIVINTNGVEVTLSQITIHGIDILAVPSVYTPPSTLALQAQGLGSELSMHYSAKVPLKPRPVTGDVDVQVKNTNISLDTLIGMDAQGFPNSVGFSYCAVSPVTVIITQLTDSVPQRSLQSLPFDLADVIQKLLDVLLCDKLNGFLQTNVTSLIVTEVDPALHKIADVLPAPYPVYDTHKYLHWNESLVQTVHNIVEKVRGFASLSDFLHCLMTDPNGAAAKALSRLGLSTEEVRVIEGFVGAHGGVKEGEREFIDVSRMVLPQGPVLLSLPQGVAESVVSLMPQGDALSPKVGDTLRASIAVIGVSFSLDTLCDLQILEPLPQSFVSLRTGASFESLSLSLSLTLTVESVDELTNNVTATYSQDLTAAMSIKGLSLLLDTVVAVNQRVLDSFYLDQMSQLGCWLSTLSEVSIPNLSLSFDSLSISLTQVAGQSAGLLEQSIVELLDNILALLVSPTGFGPLTEELVAGVIQGPVREGLTDRVSTALAKAKGEHVCLTHYPYDDDKDFVSWSDSRLITALDTIVNDLLGVQGINKVFSCASGDGSGSFAYYGERLEVIISGLNSFYELVLLSPVTANPYDLWTSIGLGYCTVQGSDDKALCNPFKLTITSLSSLASAALDASLSTVDTASIGGMLWEISRHIELSAVLENLSLSLDLFAKVDKDAMRDLTVGQMGVTGCKASTFDSISVQELHVNVSHADIVYSDGTMDHDATRFVNRFLGFLTRQSSIDSRNADLATRLANAGPICQAGGVTPASTDDDIGNNGGTGGSDAWKWEMFILIIACLGSLAALLLAYQIWGDKHKSPLSLCTAAFTLVPERQPGDTRTLWERCDFDSALVFHPEIPFWVRYGIPAALIVTMSLFLQSNLLPDSVNVVLTIYLGQGENQKKIDVGSIFGFGLANTVRDMWSAKVYALAILIAFFSGAWPYIKLAVMFYAWVAPPAICSVHRRESALIYVDALGKWSLIDFYVMMLMLCAFYMQLYIIKDEIYVDVHVRPNWGFYGFVLATMFSLGLGHLALACHRLVTEPKVLVDEEGSAEGEREGPVDSERDTEGSVGEREKVVKRQSLSSMRFLVSLDEEKDSDKTSSSFSTHSHHSLLDASPSLSTRRILAVKTTPLGRMLILATLCISALFVVAGMFMLTMEFDFKGLIGLMLKNHSDVSYSYVSIGTSIPEHSGTPNDFGVRWLQASFFLFGLGMPLGYLLCTLGLWFVPLSLSHMRQLHVLSEVMNAWSAIDVFCISIAAALLEIQQFAAFVVGDSCDGINKILEKYMDPILDGDDKCFDVVANLNHNSWIVFTAAALLLLVSIPSLAITGAAIKQRLDLCGDRHDATNWRYRFSREQVLPLVSEFGTPLLGEAEGANKRSGSDHSGSVGDMPADSEAQRQMDRERLTGDASNGSAGESPVLSPHRSPSQSETSTASVTPQGSWSHRMSIGLLYRLADLRLVDIQVKSMSRETVPAVEGHERQGSRVRFAEENPMLTGKTNSADLTEIPVA